VTEDSQRPVVPIAPTPRTDEDVDDPRPSPLAHFRQIVNRLRHYEQTYGMPSDEFYRQFQSGAIPDGPSDYFDWRVLYDSCQHMQKRFGFSREQLAED